MKLSLGIISSIFLIINACGSQKSALDFTPISHEIIAQGQFSPVLEKKLIVATDGTQNTSLLDAAFLSENGLHTVNYDTHMLLEVFIGEQNSAGYSVTIDALQENENEIHFYYTIISPNGMAAAVITQPFLIAQLPKTEKTILFFENGKYKMTNDQ